jgi:hypothetical protein
MPTVEGVKPPEQKLGAIQNDKATVALANAQYALTVAKREGKPAEELAALEAAVTEAQADFNEVIKTLGGRDIGRGGDAASEALADAERFDLNRYGLNTGSGGAPASKMRLPQRFQVDDDGNALPEEFRRAQLQLIGELGNFFPIPDEYAADPVKRRLCLPTNDPMWKAMQQANDTGLFLLTYARKNDGAVQCRREAQAWVKGWGEATERLRKAMDTITSAEGGYWVPSYFSADFVDSVHLEPTVLGALTRFPMAAPTAYVPTLTGDMRAYRRSQSQTWANWGHPAGTTSAVTASRITFEAEEIGILVAWSDILAEDSIVAIAPTLRRKAIQSMALGVEDALINGSSLITDLDNADGTAGNKLWAVTPGSNDIRNSWDGLRKIAQTSASYASAGGDAMCAADCVSLMKVMGKFAMRKDCKWLMGVDSYFGAFGWDELETMDKLGPGATIVTGQIGQLYGRPLLVSENVYGPGQGYGLNASGVWDNQTKTLTITLLMHPDAMWVGDRRLVTIEPARDPLSGLNALVVTARLDAQHMFASTDNDVGYIYNGT